MNVEISVFTPTIKDNIIFQKRVKIVKNRYWVYLEFTSIHPSSLSIKQSSFWKLLSFISVRILYLVIRLLYPVISWQVSYREKNVSYFLSDNFLIKTFLLFLLLSCFSSIWYILILNFCDVNITFGAKSFSILWYILLSKH